MASKQTANRYGNKPRVSPLYTSKARELDKLEFLQEHGRDTDGAYRVTRRKDSEGAHG